MEANEIAWVKRQIADASSLASDLEYSREHRFAIDGVLEDLDEGKLRVAEKIDGAWHTHEWIKQAILLHFKLNGIKLTRNPLAYDQVPLKWEGWGEDQFRKANFRMVAGAVVRHSAYIGPGAILMPCFVNMGARVGADTMIDTWATVGSCTQVGSKCHISGGVGLGGVLEPIQAHPVIIEDNCFIGARSEITEGVIVEEGAVIGMGVFIALSTPIIERSSGRIFQGRVPAGAVVLSGTRPGKPLPNGEQGPHMPCTIIVKYVDAKTRAKTSPNEILRAATLG